MIKDKYIPITLGLISMVCFVFGGAMTLSAMDLGSNYVPWLRLTQSSIVLAAAGFIHGFLQMVKRKASGLAAFGTILSGMVGFLFIYVLLMVSVLR